MEKVNYLGVALIISIVGMIVCFLAFIGYETEITYSDNDKKIEVRAENSNSLGK